MAANSLSEGKQQELLLKERKANSAWRKLCRNKSAVLGLIMIAFVLLVSIFGPFLMSRDPAAMDFLKINAKPGTEGFLLGSDNLGRDMLTRLVYGGRVSLLVGFVSTAMGLVIGTICGLLAAYYPKLDNPIMRVMDLLFTFPSILLAMLIIAMLGVNAFNTMLAISVWSIPSFARMVRGRALQVKEEDYVMATRSLGAKDSRILFIHILKNCLPVIIVTATMRIASSIISISTLSYLGMGVTPPMPEWGDMISAGKEYLWNRPSLTFIPGITVMVTVICFNILGDKLRDILDPSLKD